MPTIHDRPDIPRPLPLCQMKSAHSIRRRLWRRLAERLAPVILLMCATGMQPGLAMEQVGAQHPHTLPAQAPAGARVQVAATPVLELRSAPQLEDIIPALSAMRVVLVGETHDRYDHHQTQLEIIRRLHALNPRLAIGMEVFQQPFQNILDDYIAGELDEQEMLRGTGYYRRWKYDFRLYAPILAYAREHGLPVIALNLPVELTDRISRVGIDNLTAAEREQLPADIDYSDTAYAQRLRDIYERHPGSAGRGFEGFLEVQLAWDEGMAERAAGYLEAHPDKRMVLLAGSGHLAYGSGIPQRLQRRLGDDMAVILNDWHGELRPGLADYLLLPQQQSLPPAGKLGALLEEREDRLLITDCLADSPCKQAGLKAGDRILSINDLPVNELADLRLIMWKKKPGDRVTLALQRRNWLGNERTLSQELVLY